MAEERFEMTYGGGSGRITPTLKWPEYADSALAGLCRLRRHRYRPAGAGICRLSSGRFVRIADTTFIVSGSKIYQQAPRITRHLDVLGFKCGVGASFQYASRRRAGYGFLVCYVGSFAPACENPKLPSGYNPRLLKSAGLKGK